MTDTERADIEIVLLAAGGSSRLGSPKQLVKYRGQTLLGRAAHQALDTGLNVHVVLGAGAEKLLDELGSLPIDVVINTDWPEGIASSVRAGCRRLNDKAAGVLIMLCDQPLVTTAHLENLLGSLGSGAGSIVASEYNGVLGVPAVFGQAYFDELLQLEGDEGARVLIARYSSDVIGVKFEDAGLDIDCEKDVKILMETG